MAYILIREEKIRYAEGYCDKCNRLVPLTNDASLLDYITDGTDWSLNYHRHLIHDAQCAGSPSRAQYIAGQPRDRRAGTSYNPSRWLEPIREAYAIMQSLKLI